MLVLLFLLLLLSRSWIISNSSYTFYSDDAIYASLARFWSEGNFKGVFHPTWPPLYPALSALFSLFTTNWETASRITALVAGTAVTIPLFFLVRKTTSSWSAVFFILSLSFFTPLLTISLMALSDSLSFMLTISGIVTIFFAFLYSPTQPPIRYFLWGSFLFGLAYLTRAEGTMFFALTMLYLIAYFLIRRQINNLIKIVSSFLIVFLLTVSPYVIATKNQIGEWSLSQKFSAQIQQGHAFSLNSRGTTWAQEATSIKSPNYQSPYFKSGSQFVLDRLYYFLRQFYPKTLKWQQVFISIFPVWVVPLILLGILSSFKKPYKWSSFYMIFTMITAIPITIFSTPVQDVRYLGWTIPLFLYFSYLGIERLISLIPMKEKNKVLVIPLVALFITLLFPGTSLDNLANPQKIAVTFSQTHDKKELKIVGEWIKNNFSGTNPRVMLRHEGVEFYAQGETVYMPQISFEQLLDYAQRNKVDYIVAWEQELAGDEKLAFLLDDKVYHSRLKKVFSPTLPNTKIVVYTLGETND